MCLSGTDDSAHWQTLGTCKPSTVIVTWSAAYQVFAAFQKWEANVGILAVVDRAWPTGRGRVQIQDNLWAEKQMWHKCIQLCMYSTCATYKRPHTPGHPHNRHVNVWWRYTCIWRQLNRASNTNTSFHNRVSTFSWKSIVVRHNAQLAQDQRTSHNAETVEHNYGWPTVIQLYQKIWNITEM